VSIWGVDLFVIRHAIAAPREEYPDDDPARPLTRKGKKRFAHVVRGLDALGVELCWVLHSPWLRAAETAALLAPIVRGKLDDALAPTDLLIAAPRAELWTMIAKHGADGAVAVVGHEPWLGELAATLAFGEPRFAENMPLRKGGVVWLDGTATPGAMCLRGFLPPAVLRRTED
jgi:phosphohistidine phosphatase